MDEQTIRTEEFQIAGDNFLAKVRELIDEGNVRRIVLRNDDGTTLLEVPLTAGVAASVLTAAFAPRLVALAAIAALVSRVTLVVERLEQ
jgi:Domain of unknown function (DUF4342)